MIKDFNVLRIGDFEIRHYDEESVWIQHDNGEGGQFKTSELLKVVEKFFYENF